ncbi:MAG: carbohydrate binding domain-containing protein, partial [Limisphaerales bacterium]
VNSEHARSGRRSLRIVDNDSGKLGSSALSETFKVKAGQRVEVLLWCYRESGDPRGLGVYIEFIDRAGEFTEERQGFRQATEQGKWTPIVVSRTAPPGTSEARIWLHTISSSVMTCYVDDVTTRIEANPRPVAISNWDGISFDTKHRKKWTAGLRWDHGQRTKVDRKYEEPQNWSRFQKVSFNLYSERNTSSTFVMIFSSENEATEGGDYYSVKIPIDFTGWKAFQFPLEDLRTSRQPVGWHKIEAIKLRADGYSQTVRPDTIIVLDGLELN